MAATILVVEDEVIIGMDIRNSLKRLGYEVPSVVATGEKAIEKAEKLRPDLILMDIMLKGSIDGVEAAGEIRNRFQLPVVFLTAHTDAKTLERAKEKEPFGYIVKPFEEKDLHTTVEIALARCRAETEIRRALEKERELNELKSRFVSMVSHEFRTPMSTILFSASLLEAYHAKWSDEKKMTHLQRIQAAVHQMTSLLDDVLVIGKADGGKLEFNPVPTNLEKFCYEIWEDIRLADSNQHPITFTCHSNYEDANIDEKLLRHILSNLLSNAVKYSPVGTPVEFHLTCQNGEATFKIQDKGIGIPPEDRQQLFETFHRAKNVGSIPGTGLGLAIVKRAVDLQGGTISVQSEVGIGTTFTVKIPVKG